MGGVCSTNDKPLNAYESTSIIALIKMHSRDVLIDYLQYPTKTFLWLHSLMRRM